MWGDLIGANHLLGLRFLFWGGSLSLKQYILLMFKKKKKHHWPEPLICMDLVNICQIKEIHVVIILYWTLKSSSGLKTQD